MDSGSGLIGMIAATLMIESLLPTDISCSSMLALVFVSAATSFLTAAAGIGGGIVLLAVMAVLVPAPAVIPVHGAVQIGSNAGRTAIMMPDVQWSILLPFVAGTVFGAGLGGLTAVQLSPGILKTGLAGFILWSVWGKVSFPSGRAVIVGTGVVSSFLTMFFGATGTFVSAMVKTLKLGRLEHVATHSACMVVQHVIKVLVFGLLGFSYGPYLVLIFAMVLSGFLGTLSGKRFLVRMNDKIFHRVLSIILTLLAFRLLYEGVMLLWKSAT